MCYNVDLLLKYVSELPQMNAFQQSQNLVLQLYRCSLTRMDLIVKIDHLLYTHGNDCRHF